MAGGIFQGWMRNPVPQGIPDVSLQLRPRERALLLEALAGLSARSATPIEITACFQLAARLEGVRTDTLARREVLPMHQWVPYELEDRLPDGD